MRVTLDAVISEKRSTGRFPWAAINTAFWPPPTGGSRRCAASDLPASADHAHGIGAVPVGSGRLHALEKAALGAADVGDLDHRAGMARRLEIGEASLRPADLAFMTDDKTGRDRAVIERLIIGAPVGHVLQSLAMFSQEIEIHRWRVIALLDQFDLQVAGIGERNAHLYG